MLNDIGNSYDATTLTQLHSESRGVKLSKGNELEGCPYQVLDLIRDFDPAMGLNIRVLNWFGHGLFLFVLVGKNHPKAPLVQLAEYKWSFDLSSTPWEYSEIILNKASTNNPTAKQFKNSNFCQWHKPIQSSNQISLIQSRIAYELNKLIFLLS
ncbi:MAG: hypothetical protein ABJC55_10750 [Algoriphagus sp.]